MYKEIFLIPNILSLTRILLLFPTGYLLMHENGENNVIIIVLLILMYITDLLDGYLARKFNMISELGKTIDPLADKICITVLVLIICFQNRIPIWFVSIVIIRDLLILIFGLYLKIKKKTVLMSNYPGKIAVLSIGIILLISIINNNNTELFNYISSLLYSISLLLIVYSSIMYFIRFKQNIGEKNNAST